MKVDVDVRYLSDRSFGSDTPLALTTLSEWDCEPRGLVQFLRGVEQILPFASEALCGKFESLSTNVKVKLVFSHQEFDDEDSDQLILTGSLDTMLHIFTKLIEFQSSKCLTWATCDQVHEEVEAAKALQ